MTTTCPVLVVMAVQMAQVTEEAVVEARVGILIPTNLEWQGEAVITVQMGSRLSMDEIH